MKKMDNEIYAKKLQKMMRIKLRPTIRWAEVFCYLVDTNALRCILSIFSMLVSYQFAWMNTCTICAGELSLHIFPLNGIIFLFS